MGAACSLDLVKSTWFRGLLVSEEAVLHSQCPTPALLRADWTLEEAAQGNHLKEDPGQLGVKCLCWSFSWRWGQAGVVGSPSPTSELQGFLQGTGAGECSTWGGGGGVEPDTLQVKTW